MFSALNDAGYKTFFLSFDCDGNDYLTCFLDHRAWICNGIFEYNIKGGMSSCKQKLYDMIENCIIPGLMCPQMFALSCIFLVGALLLVDQNTLSNALLVF